MAYRLQVVPRHEPRNLLDLPWSAPLAEWDHPRLIDVVQGLSRHVVRVIRDDERAYALKEMPQGEAEHEYAMLRLVAANNLPVVEAIGLVTERVAVDGTRLDAVLISRFLDFSLPYRYLFGVEGGIEGGPWLSRKLVDAAVVLLVRLHSGGFYWGDCSLSNLLFRRDAGSLMAYLVDAETTEHRVPLPAGMRDMELDVAKENFAGGLLDLAADGQLPEDIDILELAGRLCDRYRLLWNELTMTEEIDMSERHLIDRRIRRLNELGFDVDELVVETDHNGDRLRVTPALVEEGHHSRELRRLTGLEVQENQARRLLNDIAAFGAYLTRVEGRPLPQAVVAARWIAEVYEPVIAKIPAELRGRREPPELFHELLEHRYYLSETAGQEVDNERALTSYLESVLRFRPEERIVLTNP